MTNGFNLPKAELVFLSGQGEKTHSRHGNAPKGNGSPAPTDLRERWVVQFFEARSLALNTQRAYQRAFTRFMAWTPKPWSEVSRRDIAHYKGWLQEQLTSKGKPQFSPASINQTLCSLKSFFGWLVEVELLEENPTLGVSVVALPKPQPNHLDEEDVELLYAVLQRRGESYKRDAAILSALSHGLRASEVSALNLGDYDGEQLVIRQAKHDSTGSVPLSPDAAQSIDDYLKERQYHGESLSSDSPLFISYSPIPSKRGRRLEYFGIYEMVRSLGELAQQTLLQQWFPHLIEEERTRIIMQVMDGATQSSAPASTSSQSNERAAVDGMNVAAMDEVLSQLSSAHRSWLVRLGRIHPHQFRHTFATRLVLMGIDSYLARKLMRHESEKSFRRYSEHARYAAAKDAYHNALNQKKQKQEQKE
jgi:integrase/recombinase XerD